LIVQERPMARINLASMSVEDLLQLRDEVGRVLSRKAGELQQQLAALGADVGGRGGRRSAMKGRTVAPKYRGPDGDTWAGRGARPRWLTALLKEGRKLEEFAIQPASSARTRVAVKRGRPAKKRRAKK
jgi:DNA-binding protein H-NS